MISIWSYVHVVLGSWVFKSSVEIKMGGDGFINVIEYVTSYKMFQHQFMCRYLGYVQLY